MMAPDSAITLPASWRTGDLPSGWTCFSSGGARRVLGSRLCWRISYGTASSSSSQRIRWDRESSRWWTISMVVLRTAMQRTRHCRRQSVHIRSVVHYLRLSLVLSELAYAFVAFATRHDG